MVNTQNAKHRVTLHRYIGDATCTVTTVHRGSTVHVLLAGTTVLGVPAKQKFLKGDDHRLPWTNDS
jgi:hypothetical protein